MLQQQKFLKRSAEEHDPGGPNDNFEPPVKLQCTTQQHGTSHQNEGELHAWKLEFEKFKHATHKIKDIVQKTPYWIIFLHRISHLFY